MLLTGLITTVSPVAARLMMLLQIVSVGAAFAALVVCQITAAKGPDCPHEHSELAGLPSGRRSCRDRPNPRRICQGRFLPCRRLPKIPFPFPLSAVNRGK